MAARSGVRRTADEQRGDAGRDPLSDARQAAAGLRWSHAYEALNAIDRGSGLAAEDLEVLATAAFLLGRAQDCRQARLRAYQLYRHRGELGRAARCAARIGLEQLRAGEVAEATGCLPVSLSACSAWAAQATALLEGEREGPEHGHVLIPVAYERLAMEDPAAAADFAAEAVAFGRRYEDPDVLALALAIQGRALSRTARLAEGLLMVDEAVTLALTGQTSPPVAGLALTSAVEIAAESFAFDRCDAWTHALARWCAAQQGMVAFQSRSLAYQAALERRHGRWDEALEIAERACAPPGAALDPTAAAAARYEQGEILRLRGVLDGADAAYRRADALALDPQPGRALLQLAAGDPSAASASLTRALGEARTTLRRASMLSALVQTTLSTGDRGSAADLLDELEGIAAAHPTPALEATALHARAAVLLAGADPSAALSAARQAQRVWLHLDWPYEHAQARLLVAAACRLLGDDATAALELDGARRTLAALGATQAVERPVAPQPPGAHGLTRRELEVLTLLATGLTNRSIADRLHVTTRTVDTHVSHILSKLGVASRAAATAFAHRHGLA